MICKKIIGYSHLNNPLIIFHFYHHDKDANPNINSGLKIFVMAGQHGDEKYGQLAVNRLMSLFTENESILLEDASC